MKKKLTISIEDYIYQGLYDRIGAGKISSFIENLVKSHIGNESLDIAYKEMAKYEATSEEDTLEWSESLISDINND